MYTMIDAIGARTGARAARAPNSHRVRPQLCLGSARQLQGSRTYPSSKPFAVATTCVAQPPRDCTRARRDPPPARVPGRRRRRRRRQGAHVRGGGRARGRRGAADEVRRGDEKIPRAKFTARCVPATDPASPQPSLAGASHPSRPTSSARPSPRTVEPTPDRPAARPHLTHPPDISQYGEFPSPGCSSSSSTPPSTRPSTPPSTRRAASTRRTRSRARTPSSRTATRAWTDRATSSTPLTRFSRV